MIVAIIAAIGCSVRVEANRPDGAEGGQPEREVRRRQDHPEQPRPERDLGAGQQRHRTAAEEDQPHRHPDQGDHERRHERADDDAGVLDEQQPEPGHRRDQQVAQGADVGLAGDAVAGHDRDRERQEQSELDRERGQGDEESVLGDGPEEVGRVLAGLRQRALDRDGDQHRHGREDEQAGLVAATSEHQAELGEEEPRETTPRAVRGPRSWSTHQPLTSKPSPVSETNRSSSDGRPTRKPTTETPACTHAATTFSGATSPRWPVAPEAVVWIVGQTQLAHHPGGVAG